MKHLLGTWGIIPQFEEKRMEPTALNSAQIQVALFKCLWAQERFSSSTCAGAPQRQWRWWLLSIYCRRSPQHPSPFWMLVICLFHFLLVFLSAHTLLNFVTIHHISYKVWFRLLHLFGSKVLFFLNIPEWNVDSHLAFSSTTARTNPRFPHGLSSVWIK